MSPYFDGVDKYSSPYFSEEKELALKRKGYRRFSSYLKTKCSSGFCSILKTIPKMFLYCLLFTILPMGCQTLNDKSDAQKKEAEVLNTQKALVISFINQGLPGMALKELRKHVINHPKDPEFKNLMGLTYLSLQNPKLAAKYFKESHKLEPRTSVALNLSSAYIEAKDYKKAIDFLLELHKHETTATYPHPERISHNIGLASEKINNLKQAERYYRNALSYNPEFYISVMRLGQVYEKTKQMAEARKHFIKARSLCDLCIDPVNALVRSHLNTGDGNSARRVLRQYMAKKDISAKDREHAKALFDMAQKVGKSPKVR